ncbi:MAG: hypothetical protein AAFX10_09130 [Pseudomonadota bacterium]
MGLLADFFVAPPDEALQYEDSLSNRAASVERFKPAEYRNLTGLEIGILWAMLIGEEWSVDKHMLTEVRSSDGGETWLLSFPPGLVDVLAGMTDKELDSAAVEWASIEELSLWEPEHTKGLLDDLRRLSNDAKSSGKELFLWGSL